MSHLDSFSDRASVAIIGAGGGIGAALTARLVNDERVASVYAASRQALTPAGGKLRSGTLDLGNEADIAAAAAACKDAGPLDLVIVATGILHDGNSLQPEKRMSELDAAAMQRVFAVNAIGPALVAKHFLPLMRRKHKTAFAAISARVGSITDNRLGGWASYRASKAALNMLLKTLSIEQARTRPDCVVVGLHPGTVDTGLSRPFQQRVPEGKLFTADYAAERLLQVVDTLGADATGGFFAWDGERIDY